MIIENNNDFKRYPIYNDDDMKNLRDNLKAYVLKKYPHITYIAACNWAFYPLNPKHGKHLNLDFWSIFINGDFDLCRERLIEYGIARGIKDPKGDAELYIRSMRWLNDYFNEIHGGVVNYLNYGGSDHQEAKTNPINQIQ